MGFWSGALELRGLERSFVDNPADWLVRLFGGGVTSSGVDVSEMTALEDPAVLSAVAGVAETIGSLPLSIFRRREGGGKETDAAHPLYELLHLAPNPEISSMTWREMLQAHLMLNGKGYSEIVRDGAGRIRELWPMHPTRVRVRRESGALVYYVRVPSLGISGPAPGGPIRDEYEIRLPASQMLHIRAFSLDGVEGLGRLRLMRESLGLSLALRIFGALFFKNGAMPGGMLEHPGRLGDTAKDNLRKSFEGDHQGLGRSHRLAILEEGMKYHELAMPNNRAQFLESREFQVGETARGLRVPGVMIGHNDNTSTYASAEQFFLSYKIHTIRPWAVRWDQYLTLHLLTERERRTHFIEHNLDGLLRGDALTRAQALEIKFRNGIISIDEWRALDNDNPLDGGLGKQHFVQLNTIPLDQIPSAPAKPADDPPRPDPDDDEDDDEDEDGNIKRRHDALALDAIRRAVKREVGAVRAAAKGTHGADAWRTWADAFYARHAAFLSEALAVDLTTARGYTTTHRAELLADGLAAADRWERSALDELAEIVGLKGVTTA